MVPFVKNFQMLLNLVFLYFTFFFDYSLWLNMLLVVYSNFPCFFFPETATVLAASYGATDWGQLCSFCSLWQRPAQRREPPVWYLWQCLTGWSL